MLASRSILHVQVILGQNSWILPGPVNCSIKSETGLEKLNGRLLQFFSLSSTAIVISYNTYHDYITQAEIA